MNCLFLANSELTFCSVFKDHSCPFFQKSKPIITNQNNNILLLGSNGFVGIHILYRFIKKDTVNIYCIVIDKNNRRRLIRALNYYKENNESINNNKTDKLLYDALFIGLTTDRSILYEKINKRVDVMVKDGLLEEIKPYYDKNIRTKPLLNAIGYREVYKYFDGEYTLEEAIEKIKQNSRHYAKRQYTFFNHQIPVVWFETDYENFNNTIEKVSNYIDSN